MQNDDSQSDSPSEEPTWYCLRTRGPAIVVDITREEFRAVKQAMDNLFILLDTEEKFGMVIENFLDYEREILNLALEDLAWQYGKWSDLRRVKALVNRRLANLLTVARLYLDHLRHDINAMYGGSGEQLSRVSGATNEQYDGRFGYRVMEALRNLLQHRSFPIAKIYWLTKKQERKHGALSHNRFSAHISVSELQRDGQLKKKVLDELVGTGREEVDIGPLIREYVEGLSLVHDEFRQATEADMNNWASVVNETLESYANKCGGVEVPVYAYALDDEQFIVDEVPIVRDGVDQLLEWRQRKLPTSISRCYVSDEPFE